MPQSKKIKPNIIKLGGLVLFFCLFTSLASAADATPPTGSIKINNGATFTNSINVTLNLSATDTGSGVAQMKFSNNNSTWSSPEPYATTKSWILSTGSGTKKVYVKYQDNAGNWSRAYSDRITLDTTLPTGSIKINNNAAYTNSINVTLNLFATDTGSGVSQMKFSNNNSTWSDPEPYNTTKAWVLTSGSGIKRVYVKYRDKAGNWSSTYSDSISLLKQAPQVGTINPASGTSVPDEAVNFSTTYSDSNGWQNIKRAYFLVNTSTSGTNCAYVYYDQNYNKLYLRNDSNTIWLGGYAPGSSYVIENSYSKLDCSKTTVLGDNVNLTVNWTVTFKSAFIGTKNTYLYVKDDANLYSNWTQVGTWSIQSQTDTIPPTGTVTINNNADYTNTPSVDLALSAQDNAGGSGLSEMQFSNDNSTWSAPESYSTTKTWTIDSIEGLKTVYVKYKDVAGNWSEAFSDTITLDATPPTGTVNINNDTQYTNSTSVTLNLSASDSGSGLNQMQFSNDEATWFEPEPYGTTKSWILPSGDGEKRVYVKFSDRAGNWSGALSDNIILDTIAPAKPTVEPSTSPTNVNLQTLSGTKEANTSIWINGAEIIPINNQNIWSYEVNLAEGANNFSITSKDIVSNESEAVAITIILDTTAPNPPQGLSAVAGDTKVDLSWTTNTEPDLAGYNIYRSTTSGLGYAKINASLITTTTYQDTGLINDTTYYYVVTAVDTVGNESEHSNEAVAIPQGYTSEVEPNNDFSFANIIQLDSPINGTINPTGDQDYFKIITTESGVISISLTDVPENIDAAIYLFDSSYNYIGEAYGDMGSNIYLQQQLTSASDYYILVRDQGNDSSSTLPYRLEVKFSTFGLYDVEIWPQHISPNNDGISDEAYLYASITAPSNWTLNIKDSSNNIICAFTGTGTDINEVWDGKDADGNVVSDGVYTYSIE
ncbi:MAG: hypothetical protein Q8O30_07390, partial [Candidatus Omnitrophota bacterium]|nr:hypothetical protein [Candidatus Omnitrophota bacterium]